MSGLIRRISRSRFRRKESRRRKHRQCFLSVCDGSYGSFRVYVQLDIEGEERRESRGVRTLEKRSRCMYSRKSRAKITFPCWSSRVSPFSCFLWFCNLLLLLFLLIDILCPPSKTKNFNSSLQQTEVHLSGGQAFISSLSASFLLLPFSLFLSRMTLQLQSVFSYLFLLFSLSPLFLCLSLSCPLPLLLSHLSPI